MCDEYEQTARDVASRFARGLCEADWFEAGRQLAGAATYALRGRRVLGRRKIIGLFRDNDEWAQERFESVDSSFEIVDVDGSVARIRFVDALHIGERSHEYVSEELAEVHPGRELIVNLTHVDLPNAESRLRAFLSGAGSRQS